jgi:NADPH-dependent curcumin reductase CurA
VRLNEERKAGRVEHFKVNLLRRVHFEGSDEVESSIQEEIVDSLEAKEAKVQGFLKRQQFYAQEKAILRDMREFCQYGAIRIT